MAGEPGCVHGPRGFHPRFSGAEGGVGVGPWLAWPVAAGIDLPEEESQQVPSVAGLDRGGEGPCSQGLSWGSLPPAGATLLPQDLCTLLSLCLLFLTCLTFRWGSLQGEQAGDVLTKLERKVELFLSLAKEPFSETPPEMGQHGVPRFPCWAIMTSFVMQLHLSFSFLSV